MSDEAIRAELTVADLAAAPELGLSVLVAGDLTRRVRCVRVVDLPRPGRWLSRGAIALTTGVAWAPPAEDVAAAAAGYAEDAEAAGAAGIAFALEAIGSGPPPALLDACERLELPLLSVPASVTPAELEEHLRAASAAGEAYLLRRRVWFQNDLLAALAEENPLQAVMTRLAHLVRGTAALYDDAGHLVASVGEGPIRLIWGELEGRERREHHLQLGRYRVLAGPVVMRGSGYWLALASRAADSIDDVGEPLLDTTRRMLSAMRGARALSRAQDDARVRGLLTLLSVDVPPERVPRLWSRLRSHRFTPQQPVRAIVASRPARPGEGPRHRADRMEQLHEVAYLSALPLVLADDRDDDGRARLLALAADEPALGHWCRRAALTHAVGVSEPLTDLTAAPAAFRDASAAARVGRRRLADARATGSDGSSDGGAAGVDGQEEGVVVRVEDVDLATWLRASRPAAALRMRAARLLGEVARREELRATLVTYLATGLDVAETARRLFLHANTVRYRLRRVEEALGTPILAPETLPNVHLALHDEIAAAARRPHAGEPGR